MKLACYLPTSRGFARWFEDFLTILLHTQDLHRASLQAISQDSSLSRISDLRLWTMDSKSHPKLGACVYANMHTIHVYMCVGVCITLILCNSGVLLSSNHMVVV